METLQSFAVLISALAVLLMSIVIDRRAASFEERMRRIDTALDRGDGGKSTRRDAR